MHRPHGLNVYTDCPCDSGKKLKFCGCWNPVSGWRPRSAAPTSPATKTGTNVPGCYGCGLGDCKGPLTREHYLTDALSREIGAKTEITGFFWMKPGQSVGGGDAAVARILCERHNHGLSGLDAVGARLFGSLRSFNDELSARAGETVLKVFNGPDVERWLLKMLCGLSSAGVLAENGVRSKTVCPPEAPAVLFGHAPWPAAWALFYEPTQFPVAAPERPNRVDYQLVSRTADNHARALRLILNGLRLTLALDAIEELEAAAVRRPGALEFRHGAASRRAEFVWPEASDREVLLTVEPRLP